MKRKKRSKAKIKAKRGPKKNKPEALRHRLNPKDNFELTYLRGNAAFKAFNTKSKAKQLEKMQASLLFRKCIKRVCYLYFRKNEVKLRKFGFEFEDILSICTTFGLQFVNTEFRGESDKDTAYILMRFVNQRLAYFSSLIHRKFDIKHFLHHEMVLSSLDVKGDGSETTMEDLRNSHVHVTDKFAATCIGDYDSQSLCLEDQIEQAQLTLSTIDFKFNQVKRCDPESEIRPLLFWARNDVKRDLERKQNTLNSRTQHRLMYNKEMRNELFSNFDKYRERLVYLATSKHVDDDVRKKAHSLCKKRGINIVEWVSEQISKGAAVDEFIVK